MSGSYIIDDSGDTLLTDTGLTLVADGYSSVPALVPVPSTRPLATTSAVNTLLLDTVVWDFCVDASGNIAMAMPPYAPAQDAASAIKLFAGELWYDTTQGIPYWTQILGQFPTIAQFKSALQAAALTVPGVVTATVYITSFVNRMIQGQVQVTDSAGNVSVAGF